MSVTPSPGPRLRVHSSVSAGRTRGETEEGLSMEGPAVALMGQDKGLLIPAHPPRARRRLCRPHQQILLCPIVLLCIWFCHSFKDANMPQNHPGASLAWVAVPSLPSANTCWAHASSAPKHRLLPNLRCPGVSQPPPSHMPGMGQMEGHRRSQGPERSRPHPHGSQSPRPLASGAPH